jgi:hypothetical protein
MVDFWANWVEAVRFTCEAQGVISARLMLFASAAPNAAVEAERMISEKIVTFSAVTPPSARWPNGSAFMPPRSGPTSRAALRKRQFQPAWPGATLKSAQ